MQRRNLLCVWTRGDASISRTTCTFLLPRTRCRRTPNLPGSPTVLAVRTHVHFHMAIRVRTAVRRACGKRTDCLLGPRFHPLGAHTRRGFSSGPSAKTKRRINDYHEPATAACASPNYNCSTQRASAIASSNGHSREIFCSQEQLVRKV